MILYRLTVDGVPRGFPGPLPANLAALSPSDASLADLNWAPPEWGYAGEGYIPAVFPDPPAAPELKVSALVFKLLFTPAERIAIRQAATTNPVVEDWLDLSNSAVDVILTSPVTIAGVNALEPLGLLTAGRPAQILAGQPPA